VRPLTTPLASWFADAAPRAAARPPRAAALFLPRDRAWRELAPSFDALVDLTVRGLPFQIAAERRYDRSGRAARLRPALAAGKTFATRVNLSGSRPWRGLRLNPRAWILRSPARI